MTRQPGKLGQFDVLVDGKVIATRGGNVLTRMLGSGGWPDPEQVIAKIAELQQPKSR